MNTKHLTVLIGVIAVMLTTCLAYAQDSGGDATKQEKKISADFVDVPVLTALRTLFEGTGYEYTFEPGITGNVNIKFLDIRFSDALARVLSSANLTMRVENGQHIIGPKKDQSEEVAPPLLS